MALRHILEDTGKMSEQLWGQAGPAAWEESDQLIVYFCKEPRAVWLGALCTACRRSWEVAPVVAQAPALGLGREQSQAASGGIVGA